MAQTVFGKPNTEKPRFIGRRDDYAPTSLMGSAIQNTKPLTQMKRYKVVQCPRCGEIQVTEATDKFKCVKCKYTPYYRTKGKWNVKIIQTNEHKTANLVCKQWKKQQSEGVTSLPNFLINERESPHPSGVG